MDNELDLHTLTLVTEDLLNQILELHGLVPDTSIFKYLDTLVYNAGRLEFLLRDSTRRKAYPAAFAYFRGQLTELSHKLDVEKREAHHE